MHEDATPTPTQEQAWIARDGAPPFPLPRGVIEAEAKPPVRTRAMFTARPRRVGLLELARDIYADIKVRMEHEEAITRW